MWTGISRGSLPWPVRVACEVCIGPLDYSILSKLSSRQGLRLIGIEPIRFWRAAVRQALPHAEIHEVAIGPADGAADLWMSGGDSWRLWGNGPRGRPETSRCR